MLYDSSFVSLPINQTGRDFFIGDLHGCMAMLRRLLAFVDFNPDCDRLIAVGDLIDRGPESAEVLMVVRESPWFHSVRGNHEEMMMAAVLSLRKGNADSSITRWSGSGGGWFAAQFPSEPSSELAAIPWRLPLAIEVPLSDGRRAGVIHASVSLPHSWDEIRDIEDNGDLADDFESNLHSKLLWSRTSHMVMSRTHDHSGRDLLVGAMLIDRYLLWRSVQPLPGIDLLISGHTPLDSGMPICGNGRLLLDTGAGHPWGRLTLFEPVSGRYWQVADPSHDRLLGVIRGERVPEVDLSIYEMSPDELAEAERRWHGPASSKKATDTD